MDCETTDCDKPASRGGLCWACLKYRKRTGLDPANRKRKPRHANAKDMVLEAKIVLDEADPLNKEAWRLAWQRMRTAMRRYVLRSNNVHKPSDTDSRG